MREVFCIYIPKKYLRFEEGGFFLYKAEFWFSIPYSFNLIRDSKMHKISVMEKYYNMLKQGTKIIELRLFDNKRRSIKTGDVIEFSNESDINDIFRAQVVKLHLADDFAALCSEIDCKKAGFNTNQDLLKVLGEFYSLERQKKWGVVGIEIKKID